MRRTFIWAGLPISLVVLLLLLLGCGGSCPEAAAPSSEGTTVTPPADDEAEAAEGSGDQSEEAEEASGEAVSEEKKPPAEVVVEPKFPENATVSEAIAAVPRGAPRANVEQDILGEPLQNPALYEPCKVGGQHFKLKVAVWGGRAVGVDVETPNKNLAECVAKQIRGVEWRDTVRSLNTVEFSM